LNETETRISVITFDWLQFHHAARKLAWPVDGLPMQIPARRGYPDTPPFGD